MSHHGKPGCPQREVRPKYVNAILGDDQATEDEGAGLLRVLLITERPCRIQLGARCVMYFTKVSFKSQSII